MAKLFGAGSDIVVSDRGGARHRSAAGDGDGDGDLSSDGEDDELAAAQQRCEETLFSVPGARCVGCVIERSRLRPIDTYVYDNAASTQPDMLWKLAANLYRSTIVEPLAHQGDAAPPWSADSLRIHYERHGVSELLEHLTMVRQLRAAREIVLHQIVRVETDETRDLDPKLLDQLLKLCREERSELACVAASHLGSGKAGGRRGRPGGAAPPPAEDEA